MLNGIFWPDKGKISVKGKVGALIAVGAGFHPMLSGRENIYINGAILGMNKKEMDSNFDAIVDSSVLGIRKPDAKIFEFALKELKTTAAESLFVGDSYEIDVLGAENAGLAAILYDPLKRFDQLECTKINKLCRRTPPWYSRS